MKQLEVEAFDKNESHQQVLKLNEAKMNKMHVNEYNFVQREDF